MTCDPHEVMEAFLHKAGVYEYDGMLPRAVADGKALMDIRNEYGRDAEQMVMRHREHDKK